MQISTVYVRTSTYAPGMVRDGQLACRHTGVIPTAPERSSTAGQSGVFPVGRRLINMSRPVAAAVWKSPPAGRGPVSASVPATCFPPVSVLLPGPFPDPAPECIPDPCPCLAVGHIRRPCRDLVPARVAVPSQEPVWFPFPAPFPDPAPDHIRVPCPHHGPERILVSGARPRPVRLPVPRPLRVPDPARSCPEPARSLASAWRPRPGRQESLSPA